MIPQVRRRRGLRKARRGGKRKYAIRKPLVARKKFSGCKYFTEIFDAGPLPIAGGIFVSALSSMINHNQYFGLFDLGTITRFDVMLVPMGGLTVNGSTPQSTGRIAWCSTQNTNAGTPGSELTILQNNDAKVVPLDGQRIITIRCYRPKPQIQGVNPAGTVLPYVPKRSGWDWLDTNSSVGQNTVFVGSQYYVSVPPGVTDTAYQVLIRVYSAFKEQS